MAFHYNHLEENQIFLEGIPEPHFWMGGVHWIEQPPIMMPPGQPRFPPTQQWRSRDLVGESVVTNRLRTGFKVVIDVNQFRPHEIKITVNGNYLSVEAKHEERFDEFGTVMRHFIRRYIIPSFVNKAMMASKMTAEGILTIEAPTKNLSDFQDRDMPVVFTCPGCSGAGIFKRKYLKF